MIKKKKPVQEKYIFVLWIVEFVDVEPADRESGLYDPNGQT